MSDILDTSEIKRRIHTLREHKNKLEEEYYKAFQELSKILLIYAPEQISKKYENPARILKQRKHAQLLMEQKITAYNKIIADKQEFLKKAENHLSELNKKFNENLNCPDFESKKNDIELKKELLKRQQEICESENKNIDIKLVPFLNNKFYKYLKNRKYSTPYYRSNFITAALDDFLAGYINFNKNLETEELLKSIKKANNRDLSKYQKEYQNATSAYDNAIACLDIELELSVWQHKFENITNLLQIKKQERIKLENQRDVILNDIDTYFQTIREELSNKVSSMSFEKLLQSVKNTDTVEDDILLDKIIELEKQIKMHEEEIEFSQKKLKELSRDLQ